MKRTELITDTAELSDVAGVEDMMAEGGVMSGGSGSKKDLKPLDHAVPFQVGTVRQAGPGLGDGDEEGVRRLRVQFGEACSAWLAKSPSPDTPRIMPGISVSSWPLSRFPGMNRNASARSGRPTCRPGETSFRGGG